MCVSGNPDDTPPRSPFPQESEEEIISTMRVGKEGNKRSATGGRLVFYDETSGTSDFSAGESSNGWDYQESSAGELLACGSCCSILGTA